MTHQNEADLRVAWLKEHERANRTERCLYDCIEEGGLGEGWEVKIDDETGHAIVQNDPTLE